MGLKLLIKNKKGFLFTMLTIVLLSLFLVSFGIYYSYKSEDSSPERVKTLNEFVFSIEKDLPRKMYASGFRIIFLMINEIVETGNPIENFNETFNKTFFEGTLNGEPEELMIGVTFDDIIESINESARKVNAELIINEEPKISVRHENPWEIRFTIELNMTIRDKSGLVSWERINIIDSDIPIIGFEDPLYLINTNGLVTNRINQTPYEYFTDGSDVSNLTSHLENSNYIYSNLAPSFIDRLEGKTTQNENGIESMVYFPKLSLSGISVSDKVCIDYIYFSSNNPEFYRVTGMPSWFKIDEEHVDDGADENFYNVSHLTY